VPSSRWKATLAPASRAASSTAHACRCNVKKRSRSSCRGSIDGASTAARLSSAITVSPARRATKRASASSRRCTFTARCGL